MTEKGEREREREREAGKVDGESAEGKVSVKHLKYCLYFSMEPVHIMS